MAFELSLAASAESGDCCVASEGVEEEEEEDGEGEEEARVAERRLCKAASGEGSTAGFLFSELLL